MIKIIKEIQEDWYLIHLEDTRYYQIWNKWDLFETLLDSGKKGITLWDEDFPMTEEQISQIIDKLKNQKQNGKN